MTDTMNETVQTESSPLDAKKEKVRRVQLSMVDDFPNHPFKVKDDEELQALKESISTYGLMTPLIVRKTENDRFELISGHRRKLACKQLGIEFVSAIVRDMTREEAVIAMVDSNLQREHILPSEKAFAYKMKLEAINHQGKKLETLTPVVSKLRSNELIGEENGESREQVRRYIRLTELVPELLDFVDENRIAFRPAVELSYLTEDEQRDLVETIDTEDATPSLSQAYRMKKLSQEGKLDMDAIFEIMTEEKPNQVEKIKIPAERFDKYFERGTPQSKIEETIFQALDEHYARIRLRNRDRDAR